MSSTPSGADAPGLSSPSSVLATRIAVDHDGPPPTIDSLGLTDGKKRAWEWQRLRAHAGLNDVHGLLSGKSGARWVLDAHALIGVVAEQVLVALEAEVEKAVCDAAIRALPAQGNLSPEARSARLAHYSRSLRFFSEGQANALVVGMHSLANLVARSLEFDRALNEDELRRLAIKDPGLFSPGSTAKAAWLSLDTPTVGHLTSLASTRIVEARELVRVLGSLRADPAIDHLFALRNTQYHRWRGESPGVTGIAHGMLSVAEQLAANRVVSFGPDLLPPYTAAEAALGELVLASRAALDAVINWMEPFGGAWRALFTKALV